MTSFLISRNYWRIWARAQSSTFNLTETLKFSLRAPIILTTSSSTNYGLTNILCKKSSRKITTPISDASVSLSSLAINHSPFLVHFQKSAILFTRERGLTRILISHNYWRIWARAELNIRLWEGEHEVKMLNLTWQSPTLCYR